MDTVQSSVVRGLPVHMPLTKEAVAVGKKQSEIKLEGNVVESYQIGQTTIRICDDFVARAPEEIERVLHEFHAAGWAIMRQQNKELGRE